MSMAGLFRDSMKAIHNDLKQINELLDESMHGIIDGMRKLNEKIEKG